MTPPISEQLTASPPVARAGGNGIVTEPTRSETPAPSPRSVDQEVRVNLILQAFLFLDAIVIAVGLYFLAFPTKALASKVTDLSDWWTVGVILNFTMAAAMIDAVLVGWSMYYLRAGQRTETAPRTLLWWTLLRYVVV